MYVMQIVGFSQRELGDHGNLSSNTKIQPKTIRFEYDLIGAIFFFFFYFFDKYRRNINNPSYHLDLSNKLFMHNK